MEKIQAFSNAFQNYNFYLVKVVTKKENFCDPFLKKFLVENNSYIYVYDFPQKKFSMGHGTYSPIPDPSINWSVNVSGLGQVASVLIASNQIFLLFHKQNPEECHISYFSISPLSSFTEIFICIEICSHKDQEMFKTNFEYRT